MLNIKLVDNCIGCRIGNTIYLHKNLIEYPLLFSEVLEHELKHTDGYGFQDIATDMPLWFKWPNKQMYGFLRKNPGALWQYSPVMRLNGKWGIDIVECGIIAVFIGFEVWQIWF